MGLSQVVSYLTLASIVSAQLDFSSYQPAPSKVLQVPEYISQSSNNPPEISLTLQVPKEDDPIPFDSYLPDTELRAPNEHPAPAGNFYDVPEPSRDLQVPDSQEWNPDHDPIYYFELPADKAKTVFPTNTHPKKYNKYAFEKEKPLAGKPKEEVVLIPISEQEYFSKIKQQDKTLLNYAKVEERKQQQLDNEKVINDSESAATHFDQLGRFAHPIISSSHGERVEFQMHGHDGPKSYKWGYDTGKGKNRQFRYEERSKDGFVKGHYGYFDKFGKLQMIHYNSHPHDGFHAEGNFGNFK